MAVRRGPGRRPPHDLTGECASPAGRRRVPRRLAYHLSPRLTAAPPRSRGPGPARRPATLGWEAARPGPASGVAARGPRRPALGDGDPGNMGDGAGARRGGKGRSGAGRLCGRPGQVGNRVPEARSGPNGLGASPRDVPDAPGWRRRAPSKARRAGGSVHLLVVVWKCPFFPSLFFQ